MAEKNNSTCAICGKGYYVCLSCRNSMSLSPWKIYTDTSEHYKIYQVLRGYSTGVFSKEEAREKLNTIDLSDIDDLRENIRSLIQEILSYGEISDINDSNIEDSPTPKRKRTAKKAEASD